MAELNRHCFSRPVPEPLMIPVKVSNRPGLLFDVRLQVLPVKYLPSLVLHAEVAAG